MIIERKYLRGVSLRDTSIPRIYLRGEAGGAPISFEGYPLELDVPNARSMKNYTIFGNTSEDAKGVGDEVVNLMPNVSTRTVNGVTFTNNGNGTYPANGTAGVGGAFISDTISVIQGHKYFDAFSKSLDFTQIDQENPFSTKFLDDLFYLHDPFNIIDFIYK